MRVVILNTQLPFVRGGAEILAESLQAKIIEVGHQAEIVRIPFKWYPAEIIPQQILACRLFRIKAASPDLVIALKFPTYYIPFPNKKVWLLHQFRQVYELWGTPFQDFPDTLQAAGVRDLIIQADNRYLPEAQAIYALSPTVVDRLRTYNQIRADGVLHHPLPYPEQFKAGESGNYFFYPSRLTRSKRQAVAIEAMRYVKSDFQLILAGKADSDEYGRELQTLIERYELQNRVKLLGFISEEEKARLMRDALAILYLPYDEDSYGYVTLEAFHSHKPLIVFTDSGGTDEVMEHEVNGLIVEPTPQILAEGMERLWSNRKQTIQMGENAYQTLEKHNISWQHVLDNLLA